MTTAPQQPLLANLLDFALPPELEATSPPEARGLRRDEVRLMVSDAATDAVIHSQFRHLPDFLQAGDVLVVNTSKTLNAALMATRSDGTVFELHLSTRLPNGQQVVELRTLSHKGTRPFYGLEPGETFQLPGEAAATILAPYSREAGSSARLWLADLVTPYDLYPYLDDYGFPIRYSYVRDQWPLAYYQTAYATEVGSAEMPSAGRAFTPELITALIAKGIQILPLILHTGVASLESHEPPYDEYYRLPAPTAALINHAHEQGWRVIAVGTTVIRALETVSDAQGNVHADEGWTSVVITPERGIHTVDGLLTGFHEPKATHLAMLEALTGRKHLQIAYSEALKERYLWHEFGDLHLLLR